MVFMALLSIGEFARAARMSVKALRHYDALGVLVPAHVDPHSGYRRYERAQLRDALLITLMRQADIGLPVVRSALADREQLPALVDAELARLRARAQRAQTALALASRLATDDPATYETFHTSVDALPVHRRRGSATAETLDHVVPPMIERLVHETGASSEPVTGRYPVQLESEFDFDVNIPSGSGRFELPGGDFVGVVHTGPFTLLPLAYHALFEELSNMGAPVTGPIRERYLSDPDLESPQDLRTEVLVQLP